MQEESVPTETRDNDKNYKNGECTYLAENRVRHAGRSAALLVLLVSKMHEILVITIVQWYKLCES